MKFKAWCYLVLLIVGVYGYENAWAQATANPALPFACASAQYHQQKNGQFLLTIAKAARLGLFVFHNTSAQTVWLDHPTQGKGMSAGWGSSLSSDHWSALVLTQSNFLVSCSQMQTDGKMVKVSCQNNITICAIKNPKAHLNHLGSFWVTENQPDARTLSARIKARQFTW